MLPTFITQFLKNLRACQRYKKGKHFKSGDNSVALREFNRCFDRRNFYYRKQKSRLHPKSAERYWTSKFIVCCDSSNRYSNGVDFLSNKEKAFWSSDKYRKKFTTCLYPGDLQKLTLIHGGYEILNVVLTGAMLMPPEKRRFLGKAIDFLILCLFSAGGRVWILFKKIATWKGVD